MTPKNGQRLTISVLPGRLGIYRLPAEAPVPDWAQKPGDIFSITRTTDELSIVCDKKNAPPDTKSVKGWRAIKVHGPLDFALTGILSSLAAPLAAAGISIFALSTFDTDYILVEVENIKKAVKALEPLCDIER